MAKNFGVFNLVNMSHLFNDEEIICSRRLVSTFSTLKKRGTRLLHSVRHKFGEASVKEKDVLANKSMDFEDLNLPPTRPKRCLCNKPKSQSKWRSRINDIGSISQLAFGKKRNARMTDQPNIPNLIQNKSGTISPTTETATAIKDVLIDPKKMISPRISTDSQNQSRLSNQAANAAAVSTEEFNSLIDRDQNSAKLSGISKDSELLDLGQVKNNTASRSPERRLQEERKSSIKSLPTNGSQGVQPMETIAEIETEKPPLKIKDISDEVIETLGVIEERDKSERTSAIVEHAVEEIKEVHPIIDIEADIEKDQPVQFEIKRISRQAFDNMKQDKKVRKIVRIDHKTLPPIIGDLDALPANQTDADNEWRDVPTPVIDEMRRVTKSKRPHNCSKACPCKFSQELIDIYHEAKLLSGKAKKVREDRKHCKFRMTSSEIDFFKEDTKMCNVMIGETQSRRAEMRELMDMWQEANEKLAVRKKEIVAILENIERTSNRMHEVEYLLRDWAPGGRMEELRKAQRANEKVDREKMEMWEDEEKTFCKKKIGQIIQKREAWEADEKIRAENRKSQRQKDTLALKNATDIMQKYIDDRKSLLMM